MNKASKPDRVNIQVKWEKPGLNWTKLNTDDSVTGHPRLAGDGGLLIKEFWRGIGYWFCFIIKKFKVPKVIGETLVFVSLILPKRSTIYPISLFCTWIFICMCWIDFQFFFRLWQIFSSSRLDIPSAWQLPQVIFSFLVLYWCVVIWLLWKLNCCVCLVWLFVILKIK